MEAHFFGPLPRCSPPQRDREDVRRKCDPKSPCYRSLYGVAFGFRRFRLGSHRPQRETGCPFGAICGRKGDGRGEQSKTSACIERVTSFEAEGLLPLQPCARFSGWKDPHFPGETFRPDRLFAQGKIRIQVKKVKPPIWGGFNDYVRKSVESSGWMDSTN